MAASDPVVRLGDKLAAFSEHWTPAWNMGYTLRRGDLDQCDGL